MEASVSWEWPFSVRRQKRSQKPHPAAWPLLTSHWPQLDHKATACWKVARKRRPGVNQSTRSTWYTCGVVIYLRSLPGAWQSPGVTRARDGVSHAVSLLPGTAHLSAQTQALANPWSTKVCLWRFLAGMNLLPMSVSDPDSKIWTMWQNLSYCLRPPDSSKIDCYFVCHFNLQTTQMFYSYHSVFYFWIKVESRKSFKTLINLFLGILVIQSCHVYYWILQSPWCSVCLKSIYRVLLGSQLTWPSPRLVIQAKGFAHLI